MSESTEKPMSHDERVQQMLLPTITKMLRDGNDNETICRLTGARPALVEKTRKLMEAHR